MLVLGVAVFLEAGRGFLDSVYSSLQLFILDDGSSAPHPATGTAFQVARFGAGLVALSAAVTVVTALTADAVSAAKARLTKGHVIVCGLDQHGRRIAGSHLEAGERLVAIELRRDAPGVAEVRRRGGPVIVGDASSFSTLKAAGITRASRVVVVCGASAVNAGVVAAIREMSRTDSSVGTIHVDARVDDPSVERFLTARDIVPADEEVSVEWFSDERLSAKAMLSDQLQLLNLARKEEGGSGFAVVGSGGFGEDLVLEAARQWSALMASGRASQRLKLVAVRNSAASWIDELRTALNGLDEILDVTLAEGESASHVPDIAGAQAVFVCCEAPMDGIRLATALGDREHGPGHLIVVPTTGRLSGFQSALSRGAGSSTIRIVDMLEICCGEAILAHTTREEVARENHHVYEQNVENMPASKPWDDLSEEFKLQDRDAARHHIDVKITAAKCELVPLEHLGAEVVTFSDEEVEALSILEHERWMTLKKAQGYRLGPASSTRWRRRHPDLVPWEELADKDKEKDRMMVRAIPEMLVASGYALRRKLHPEALSPELS